MEADSYGAPCLGPPRGRRLSGRLPRAPADRPGFTPNYPVGASAPPPWTRNCLARLPAGGMSDGP